VSQTGSRTAARALSISLAVTGGILALNLLTGVLLARTLGPDGRGQLTAVLLWPSLLLTIGGLGVNDSLTYFAARGSDEGELVGSGIALSLSQSAVLFLIGLVIEPLVLHHYVHAATVSSYIVLIGFVPASLIALNLLGIINGRQRLVSYQLLRGLVIVLTAVGLLMTAILGLEIWMRDRPHVRLTRKQTRAVATFGLKSQTSNVSVALNGNLDQLLVSVVLPPRALGLYTIASTVGWTVTMVGYSFAPVALPVVAAASLDPAAQRDRARAMVSATIALSAIVAIPLIVLAPHLIVWVFGHRFHGAGMAARILLAGSAVFGVNRTLEAVLKAVGRPLDAGLAETVALIVTAASLAILIQFHGLPGVAAASLLGALASFGLLVSRTRRVLDLGLRNLWPRRRDVREALALARHRAG
jgi:O-antigen/teichoic acid export membrane protein